MLSTYLGGQSEAREEKGPAQRACLGRGRTPVLRPGLWLEAQHPQIPLQSVHQQMRNKLVRNRRTLSPLGLAKA